MTKKKKADSRTRTENIIRDNTPKHFHNDLDNAIELMKKKHKDQRRISGERFYNHPVNVAATLAEMGMDTVTILAALLHNTASTPNKVENEKTLKEIETEVGIEVADMIRAVHEFSRATKSDSNNELKIQYIMRSTNDLRPILIKLADKLDNARTIDALPVSKQKEVAQKILDIYSPLSEYVNQYMIKRDLEEAAFRILMPEEYSEINMSMESVRSEYYASKDNLIEYLRKVSRKTLKYNPKISSRLKGDYSIYKKLQNRRLPKVEAVWDLIGFQIVVNELDECYKLANMLVKNGEVLLEFYDDYIRQPKNSGYKSIHIVTKLPKILDRQIEIHILTEEMYHFNTYGPASHLSYKYKMPNQKEENAKYYWVKQIHHELYEYFTHPHLERSHPLPNDTFSGKVFVFTPQNNIISLPIGSTAVDFAYKVHSSIGHQAVSVMINGERKPLSYNLQNGDIVEIVTDPNKKLPDKEWLVYVRTRKARDEIENEFKRFILSNLSTLPVSGIEKTD